MSRLRAAVVAGMVAVSLIGGAAHAAIGPELDKALTPFKAAATPGQLKQLTNAMSASPGLEARLTQLAASGKLRSVELIQPGDRRLPANFLGAAAVDGTLLFTSNFLANQPPKRLFDVAQPTDILPDNLVFVLGHLSHHLETPFVNQPRPTITLQLNDKLTDEAEAYIQGWDDLVDAATTAKERPLVVAEGGSMLINLRYRQPFMLMLGKPEGKNVIENSGEIKPTPQNVAVFANALGSSNIADFD